LKLTDRAVPLAIVRFGSAGGGEAAGVDGAAGGFGDTVGIAAGTAARPSALDPTSGICASAEPPTTTTAASAARTGCDMPDSPTRRIPHLIDR
ncbi:MAG: hypothetical protein QOE38_1986, partial [Thermoleophilaceae bacterium]|nr:hypothetical protein [Thermoleophilaceae bacterium]